MRTSRPPERLALRRQRLLARAGAERNRAVILARRWQAPLSIVDTGIKILGYCKRHPWQVLEGVAVAWLSERVVASGWKRTLWLGWKCLQAVRR